jgi:hypothetical protein
VHSEGAARGLDGGAQAGEDRLSRGRRELAVPAEGWHSVQPFSPDVPAVPVEPPAFRLGERVGCPYPRLRLGKERRVGVKPGQRAAAERRAGQRRLVHRAEGFRQVTRRLEHIPEQGEPSAGPQYPRRLHRAGHGIHPVPGLPGDDRVKAAPGAVPVLERRHLGVDSGATGEGGHPRVGLDAENPAPRRLELPRGDAGAGADVEHGTAGAGGGDPRYKLAGIVWPGPVIAFRVRAEGLRDRTCPM